MIIIIITCTCIIVRELAYQISDQFTAFGKHIHIRVQVIIGGAGTYIVTISACLYCVAVNVSIIDMMKQAMALSNKPHVVIATPGRLADHLNSTDTLSLKKIKFLVGMTIVY